MAMTPAVTGRPTVYDAEKVQLVLDLVESGMSLTIACEEAGLKRSTFNLWVREDRDGLSAKYACAKTEQLDVMSDNVNDVASGARRLRDAKILNVVFADNMTAVARDRGTVDAYKFTLAKNLPKKYGDRYIVPPSEIPVLIPVTDDEITAAQKQFDEK